MLRCGVHLLAIDPYLSDSLAVKYRGGRFPHVRMMPPPLAPEELTPLDAVFCTHAHTDHMDPGTLGPLARANPACRFVVPRWPRQTAVERGVPPERMVTADAGESGTLAGGIRWQALASAHEEAGDRRRRACISSSAMSSSCDGLRVYHSGDCVPYPGLADQLRRHAIDVAILPVNGRDAERSGGRHPRQFHVRRSRRALPPGGHPRHAGVPFRHVRFQHGGRSVARRADRRVAGPPQCVRPRIGRLTNGYGSPVCQSTDGLPSLDNPRRPRS